MDFASRPAKNVAQHAYLHSPLESRGGGAEPHVARAAVCRLVHGEHCACRQHASSVSRPFQGHGRRHERGRRQAAEKKVSEPCGPWALQADPRFNDCRGALRRGCRATTPCGRKEQARLSYHSPSTMARSCSDRRRRHSAASSASSRAICASASSAACRYARLTFFPRLHLAFTCTNWHSYAQIGIHKHSCKYIIS